MAALSDLFVTYKNTVTPHQRREEESKDKLFESWVQQRVDRYYQDNNTDQSTDDSDDDFLEGGNDEETMDADYFLQQWDEQIGGAGSSSSGSSSSGSSSSGSSEGSTSGSGSGSINIPTGIVYNPSSGSQSRSVVTYNKGNLSSDIEQLFKKHGIDIKITSGKRKAGAAGRAGDKSHHVTGNAVDIIPGGSETFDSLKQKILDNQEIREFLYYNGLGIIDETDPDTMRRTGATGAHFHIGPDQLALDTMGKWLKEAHISIADEGMKIIAKADKTRYENGSFIKKIKEKDQQGKRKTNLQVSKGDPRASWTNDLYKAYLEALKQEYGDEYSSDKYREIASYMTYQSALESGYGQHANGYNYGGHKKNGETVHYDSMKDFVNAQMKTLKKWDIMNSDSLKDYVDSLYTGKYRYCDSQSADDYYNRIKGTTARVNAYLNIENN